MQVKDLMATEVVSVSPRATIAEAIQLLLARKVSGLPVVDEAGDLVGVLSEGDLLRRIEFETQDLPSGWLSRLFRPGGTAEAYRLTHGRKVGDIMSRRPVTIDASAPLGEAVALMERHRIKRLPVLDSGKLVGIVSRADFVKALARFVAAAYEEPAISDAEIKDRILAELRQQSWTHRTAIEVGVQNGHVDLRGMIVDEDQRDAARVLAENVIGVQSVADHLVWSDPPAVLMP